MAQVTVRVVGGKTTQLNVNTVGEAKASLGLGSYSAAIGGAAVRDDQVLRNGDTVTLATASKGGC